MLGFILYVEGFEIQIFKSLVGIYTRVWINRMFLFLFLFYPFAFDLIEQVRVMVSTTKGLPLCYRRKSRSPKAANKK